MVSRTSQDEVAFSATAGETERRALPMDAASFRQVMGRFATGVTVVTTLAGGEVHGMTVNAFMSLSIDPMMVLISVDKRTLMHELLLQGHVFSLTFLAEDQESLSRYFSTRDRPRGAVQFAGIATFTDQSGAPLLEGGLAYIDCEVAAVYDGGDHSLFAGRVLSLWMGAVDKKPLLYFASGYVQI